MISSRRNIGIVTLPGFNEIDSFVAARMIDSVPDLYVHIVGPDSSAVSMAGVEVQTPGELEQLAGFDAVVIGSGNRTFEHIENSELMDRFGLDPDNQLLGTQCSGAAILHRLGLADGIAVCTDLLTAPKLEAVGVSVAHEPFRSYGTLATAGGCLSSVYLAYWTIKNLTSTTAADLALSYVAPVGETEAITARAQALTGSQRGTGSR